MSSAPGRRSEVRQQNIQSQDLHCSIVAQDSNDCWSGSPGYRQIDQPPRMNGKVVITSRLEAHDMIEVTVADNGPGIESSIANRIFHPLQTSKKSGMGIGLSLSRTIIETHDGKLWVDKNYKDGTLFGFVLHTTA